jgi:hypothetical protein
VTERAHPRILTNTRASLFIGSRRVPFTIDNISVGGARLIGTLALRLGQRIHLFLELDVGMVEVDAEVVRVDTPDLIEDQVAVRFVDASPEASAALRGVVARVLEEKQREEEEEPELSIEDDDD